MLSRAAFRKPESRSFALAGLCLLAIILEPFWSSAVPPALPDGYMMAALFGLGALFYGDGIWRWRCRDRPDWEEPRHSAVFLLTSIGGAVLLAAAMLWPAIWSGTVITLAAGLCAGVLIPGLKVRLLGAEGDERYRLSQLRAREAGLRALVVLGAGFILLDLSTLVQVPLWFGAGVVLWGVASTVTGVMWWLERSPDA